MSPPAFRSSSPSNLPSVESLINYTFTNKDPVMKALNTNTVKSLAASRRNIKCFQLCNEGLAHKALSLGIDNYLTLHQGCQLISGKMLATAVKVLVGAVEKDQEALGRGVEEIWGVMGRFGIGNYRRPSGERKLEGGKKKGSKWVAGWGFLDIVCESDRSEVGSEMGDLLGVPEFVRSGASKEAAIWNGESLI
jgi:hypothetical protein